MLGKIYRKIKWLVPFQIVICLMVLFPMALKAQEALPQEMAPAKSYLSQHVNFRDKFYDAAAINGSAWIVGYYGTILHASENMTHFERQDSGTKEPLLSVSFTDETHGVIVGTKGLILKTVDGGRPGLKSRRNLRKICSRLDLLMPITVGPLVNTE